MANKIVSIPVSEIDGLLSGGKYIFQYRIKSKDGNRVSDWSSAIVLPYPVGPSGSTSSILELYAGGAAPDLTDNHALSGTAYAIPTSSFPASITKSEQDESLYVCSWSIPEYVKINQKFDVYISWKDSNGWRDFAYSGTTTANNFTFERVDSDVQYVQVAIFASSYPKYTYFKNNAEQTFLAMTPAESVWQGASGTLGTITNNNPYSTGTITGIPSAQAFPAGSKYVGRRIFADSGLPSNAVIKAASRGTSGLSITITSTGTLTAGAVTGLRF